MHQPFVRLGQPPQSLVQNGAAIAVKAQFNVTLHQPWHNLSLEARRATVYNPFVIDDRNLVLNLACSTCHGNGIDAFEGLGHAKSIWLASTGSGKTVLRGWIANGGDTRVVNYRGSAVAFFTRFHARQRKDVWLAHFNPYRELKLQFSGRQPSEGNWLPFVHDDRLHVVYKLCPFTVLSVDAETGSCQRVFMQAHNVSVLPMHQGHQTNLVCDRRDRGSANGLNLHGDGTIVGLGHQKSNGPGRWYGHFFFRRNLYPPFQSVARSAIFVLPLIAPIPRNLVGRTQFSVSLRMKHRSVLIDYSLDDRCALTTAITWEVYCNFTGWCTI
eukprot:Transcript_27972.p1 GENE.Transcript_27972~~Transcript_27972.p1  ORF type:complete len:327 (+),score=5.65 Transcript_27972:337-1317(+)